VHPVCCGVFLMQNTSMVSLDGGSACKVDDVLPSRAVQDGGYALPWQRYDNNKMAAMRYYQFTIDAYACSFHVNCKEKIIITSSVYTSTNKSTV